MCPHGLLRAAVGCLYLVDCGRVLFLLGTSHFFQKDANHVSPHTGSGAATGAMAETASISGTGGTGDVPPNVGIDDSLNAFIQCVWPDFALWQALELAVLRLG